MSDVGIFRVAVSAVVVKDNKLLVTKRSAHRDHAPNVWELGVTGRVDQGESMEQALLREVYEETQLTIEIVKPFRTFHFYHGSQKVEHLGVNFWCRYINGEVILNEKEQVEYRWITGDEAESLITWPDVTKALQLFREVSGL